MNTGVHCEDIVIVFVVVDRQASVVIGEPTVSGRECVGAPRSRELVVEIQTIVDGVIRSADR